MHMYVAARGILKRIREWEHELSSKYIPYLVTPGRRSSDNKKWIRPPSYGMVQLSVRPIQLYELVFPKEALPEVAGMIQPYGGYGIKPKLIGWLRKILQKVLKIELTDIPQIPPEQGQLTPEGVFIPPKNYLNREGIDVVGIGIKEDKEVKMQPVEDL